MTLSGTVTSTGNLTLSGTVNSLAAGTYAVNISGNAATATNTNSLSTASGAAPSYSARAWVNFNGIGAVAIRASGNVDTIVDNSTGNYTIQFATPLPDADYTVVLTNGNSASTGSGWQGANPVCLTAAPLPNEIRTVWWTGGQATPRSVQDSQFCYAAVFR